MLKVSGNIRAYNHSSHKKMFKTRETLKMLKLTKKKPFQNVAKTKEMFNILKLVKVSGKIRAYNPPPPQKICLKPKKR